MQKPTSPPRRPNKTARMWPWVVCLCIFFVAAIAGAWFASQTLMGEPEEQGETQGKDKEMLMAKEKTIIMIMGVDEREDDVGRSDTLMVATLDPYTDQAALLSVPRDTRVKIRGHDYDKINAAYAYGGYRLAKNTVEDFLGVQIDHYVLINTKAFKNVIDAIGGVDIDVEKRMYYEDPWDDDGGLVIDLYPGMQHMDGKTAITYVRYRDEEGDIGRIGRQQKFMKAAMEKMLSPSTIPKLPKILKEILGSVETDLSLRQMLEFAGSLKAAEKNGLKTEMVPGRPLYIDGISYWIPDIRELRYTVAHTLDAPMSGNMRIATERESREYESSIPSGATDVPSGDTSIGRMEHWKPASGYSGRSQDRRRDEPQTSQRTEQRSEGRVEQADEPLTERQRETRTVEPDLRSEDTYERAAGTANAPDRTSAEPADRQAEREEPPRERSQRPWESANPTPSPAASSVGKTQ